MSTNNTPSDEILEKLAKILRLANNSAATPGEAEAAMGRAKALAMQHQIDLAMVNLTEKSSKGIDIKVQRTDVGIRSQKFQVYHKYIWWTLQDVFGVRVIRFGKSRFCFVGEATDVLVCCQLFPWLEDVFYSTYNEAAKRGVVQRNAAGKNGVYWGLQNGLVKANKQEEQKLDAKQQQCWGLVVRSKEQAIDAQMAVDFPKLKSTKARDLNMDWNGFRHGKEKGEKIKLDQVSAPKQTERLN